VLHVFAFESFDVWWRDSCRALSTTRRQKLTVTLNVESAVFRLFAGLPVQPLHLQFCPTPLCNSTLFLVLPRTLFLSFLPFRILCFYVPGMLGITSIYVGLVCNVGDRE
jgi:hypothetical protein